MFVMPGQSIGVGPMADIRGRLNLVTVKGIVVLAVVKLLSDASADLKLQIGRYRHIASIEQAMNIPP